MRLSISSWTLFIITTLGLIMLLVAVPTVTLASPSARHGHAWSTGNAEARLSRARSTSGERRLNLFGFRPM